MPWVQLLFDVAPAQCEQLEDCLLALGAAAVSMQDNADQPLYEPLPGETPMWEHTRLAALFDAETDSQALVTQVQQTLGGNLNARTEILEDKDWVREWMKDYHPMCFGERLWICPSWLQPPEPQAVNLLLDPGLAFGSGTHPTTRLCMQWLDAHPCDHSTVIDYGCGSGILAVAALLLGAAHAHLTDIDPQALDASRSNAERNHLADSRLSYYLPDQLPTTLQADIVLANILATPLIALASTIAGLAKPGAKLVLSGILPNQAQEVISAYQPWVNFAPPVELDGWVRLDGERRQDS